MLGFVMLLDLCMLCIVVCVLLGDLLVDVWYVGVLFGGFGIEFDICCCNCVNGVVCVVDGDVLMIVVE